MFRKLKLGTQFTLLLTLIFLGGIILSSIALSEAIQRKTEDEISTKAEILIQTMNAVRSYTSEHIAPLLQNQIETTPTFIREIVPAFSARQVFEIFRSRSEYHDFSYKEATLNPTNLNDKADEFETKVVEQFRKQPHLVRLSGYRNIAGAKQFFTASPLMVNRSSCLQCHSYPSIAPKSQIASFGVENGFGWKLNDIVAAQTIYLPSEEVFVQGRQYLLLTIGIFVLVFAVLVLLINGLLKQRVIYPIKQLTAIARNIEFGALTTEQVDKFNARNITNVAQREDELGQLVRAFQHMAQKVSSRERHLEQQVHLLQVSIDEGHKKRLVTEIAKSDHFQQLQKWTKGSRDIKNLHCFSLYPPLSRFFPDCNSSHTATHAQVQSIKKREKLDINSNSQNVNASKLVVIHSFRGGTGKSNIISNLAFSFAKQGKRVGIIDTDLQSPGVHMLFGLDDETIKYTLNDYLWGRCALYEAVYDLSYLLQQTTKTSNGAIYLIPASVKANEITRILREGYHEEILLNGFTEITRDLQLDFLFIDTHPGINEETLQAIAVSNLLVMVLRPDYQDYQGTAVIAELARMLSVSKMLLIVNKVLPTLDVEMYRQQLEAAYNVSVAEILPFSEEMMHLASSEIFSMRYPDHPLAKALDAIAQHIIE